MHLGDALVAHLGLEGIGESCRIGKKSAKLHHRIHHILVL